MARYDAIMSTVCDDTEGSSTGGLIEDNIMAAILAAVSEQRLPAGTKLGEQSLSDLFGCNRANVRRALAALAAQHVVELRPHRGAFVATPSPKEAREVFEARRAVESMLARKAVERVKPEDIAQMRATVQEEALAQQRGDKPAELRYSRAFHMQLATVAGNRVMERFLADLTLRTTLILGLYSTEGISDCAEDEHVAIVDALEARDADRLLSLLDAHLRHLEAKLEFDRTPRGPLTLAEQLTYSRPGVANVASPLQS